MPERWFRVPLVEEEEENGRTARKGKYGELAEGGVSYNYISEPPQVVALFTAERETLAQIAQKDDVEPLSEVEAMQLQQTSEPPRWEQGPKPKPPSKGEGESNKERLNDFISRAERSTQTVGEGAIFGRPENYRGDIAFIQSPVYQQSLTEMRRFPSYLFDLILRPEASVISHEFFYYWDWTSTFVGHVSSSNDVFEILTKPETAGRPSDFGFAGIFQDFFSSIELVRFPRKLSGYQPRVVGFIADMTGFDKATQEASVLRLQGPSTLSILDGLVSRRCELDMDGNLQGSVEMIWRPDEDDGSKPNGGGFNYHDRLQYWHHYRATDTVADTLEQIDDLNRYNSSYLERMAGVMGNKETLEEEIDTTGHFLRVLSDQRSYNIHGNGSSATIAPLALSLCCLIFWDMIEEDFYAEHQETILKEMRQSQTQQRRTSNQ